ncbi:metal-sensitive transcriptional regulator [Clostridium sp. YIM B02515]|uniref:Metal-sensitive transcriptional regulator n=1 Tax=Clostridium rhizosphaerae TaxID=2803861 RepID=A0ABS1T9W3_9CLOT|nr:metal-sensitive transcriptional regulator [Clostridium rhizosphaerae]MBL4935134.1 metal-sensitive transcriptional regulator [Clostridium rhizosphaerae]
MNSKKDIQNRLKRIEGQVKGVQKMIESDSNCKEVLIQIAAIRSALNKVGGIVLENYAKNCITDEESNCFPKDKVDEIMDALLMFIK